MAEAEEKPLRQRRPKKPRPKAIVDVDGCTGCEVCMDFCPVDCILKLPGEEFSIVHSICVVDEERCTGCTICARECPWETIAMVYPEDADLPEESFVGRYKIQGNRTSVDSRQFPTARREESMATTARSLAEHSYNG